MLSTAEQLEIAAFAKHHMADDALREVLPLCAAAGVRVLAAKGIVSSRILYTRREERYLSDVDLRIAASDVATLSRAFAPHFEVLPVRQRGAFSVVAKGMLVEFESSNGSPGLSGVGIEELLGRAQKVDWFEAPLYAPEFHDHVVSLVVNAFKDKLWHCPPWSLEDLSRAALHPAFRERVLIERLQEAGLSSVGRVVAAFLMDRASPMGLHQDGAARLKWRRIADALSSTRPAYEWAVRETFQDPEGWLARVVMRLGNDVPRNRFDAIVSLLSSLRS